MFRTLFPHTSPDSFYQFDNQLRASGRTSRGVKSLALREDDEIADMDIIRESPIDQAPLLRRVHLPEAKAGDRMLLAVTRGGYGKRMRVNNFSPKGRGGKGVIAIKFKNAQDDLVALSQARNFEELLLITQKGTTVRISVAAVSEQGRTATGVQLQRLDPDDVVASVAIVPRLDDNEATDEEPTAET